MPKATYFNMNLTEEQKSIIRDNYVSTPDLIELTRLAFDNDSLDGRTKEGRAVRKFLIDEELDYKTREAQKKPGIELTKEQISFIKS